MCRTRHRNDVVQNLCARVRLTVDRVWSDVSRASSRSAHTRAPVTHYDAVPSRRHGERQWHHRVDVPKAVLPELHTVRGGFPTDASQHDRIALDRLAIEGLFRDRSRQCRRGCLAAMARTALVPSATDDTLPPACVQTVEKRFEVSGAGLGDSDVTGAVPASGG